MSIWLNGKENMTTHGNQDRIFVIVLVSRISMGLCSVFSFRLINYIFGPFFLL